MEEDTTMRSSQTKKRPRHPLKMPLRKDPVTNKIICRFHNYDAMSGCKKYNSDRLRHTIRCSRTDSDTGDSDTANGGSLETAGCALDHETCHVCLQKGHPAHSCPHLDDPSSHIWREFSTLTLKNTRPEDYPTHKTVLGDPILWIGDTYDHAASVADEDSGGGGNDPAATATATKLRIAPPKLDGFCVGVDDQLWRCKRQKKREASMMLQLPVGAVVVDVGAHLGDTVLTLAIHARAKRRHDLTFVALEPCAEKCDFLRSVVAANQLTSRVVVRCAAVGDSLGRTVRPASNAKERATRDGSLRYEYCPSKPNDDEAPPMAHSHFDSDSVPVTQCTTGKDSRNGTEEVEEKEDTIPKGHGGETESRMDTSIRSGVPMITLDSIMDQISPLGLLHIDVEGWESNVLRGAKTVLSTPSDSCRHSSCFVIAEAWTEKESLRRGVSGNAEEKIVRVMQDEVNPMCHQHGVFFERINDIVDVERNLVYLRKNKPTIVDTSSSSD